MRLGEYLDYAGTVDPIHGHISVRRKTIQTGTKGQIFQDTKTKTSSLYPYQPKLQSELTTYKELQSNYAQG